ncbi:hypothetical protein PROFUN_10660 [Planoprotostelium fungivorum]|uniref:Adenylate kinase 7 n=1 Tax=Planoprotostelium fungivorum TaxID=1890364 RepID=A0A2P6MUU1_9EUKA|nr:hypothetical protein PROFUN_10660 [Planoprotostelium fungivorum]
MRFFINRVDSFFGGHFVQHLFGNQNKLSTPDDSSEAAGQINGTVESLDTELHSAVTKKIQKSDAATIKEAILNSDVIVIDILQDLELAQTVVDLLNNDNIIDSKTIIFLSSVLTWGMTKPAQDDDEAHSFAEEDYRKRRAHPNYKNHLLAEKLLLRNKKANLRPYVVCSGLLYGEGEDLLHPLFKSAWKGEQLLCCGEGNNIVPTIHIKDLIQILLQIVVMKPEDKYILAVDASNNTQLEIIKSISSTLGSGQVGNCSKEEVLLQDEVSQSCVEILNLNLRTEPVIVNELDIVWESENGIVEYLPTLIHQFVNTRKLTPIKIVVHGPPSSGRTFLSDLIAKEYNIEHVMYEQLLQEERSAEGELSREIKESQEEKGKITEELASQLIRKKLLSWSCQNQGYVLDGVPDTISMAKLVFTEEEQEGRQTSFKPEFVFVLEATDQFLKERVLNLPQDAVKTNHNDEAGFTRRLQSFREQNKEDNSVTNFYEDQEAVVVSLSVNENSTGEHLLEEVTKIVGKPHNYGMTPEQMQAEQERIAQEEAEREVARLALLDEQEKNEKLDREVKEAEWAVRMEKLQREERSVLELQSAPFRTYLVQNVMPTLTAALIEICQLHPDDPIDYLAEYLFKHSSE